MTMSKTPITILQEMMIKLGELPKYECVAQSGPQHMSLFEYRCTARGRSATATARTKKEAKQQAALNLLTALGACADAERAAPAPAHSQPALPTAAGEGGGGGGGGGGEGAADCRKYVSLLNELCEEYKLGGVQYELVGDTGPPHCRRFTMSAALGRHCRSATATTKKHARQLAAERLYAYLRENLAAATRDFVEEEAISRAIEKAMSRYDEAKDEQPWRPHLGQRIADYHKGLFAHTSDERRRAVADALAAGAGGARDALERAAAALGLTAAWSTLPAESGELSVVALEPASPALVFAGRDERAAAAAALHYVRLAHALHDTAIAADTVTAADIDTETVTAAAAN